MKGQHIHAKAIVVAFAIALVLPYNAWASPQLLADSVGHRVFWVDLGLGQGTMSSSTGLTWRAGLGYEMERHVVSARVFGVSQLTLVGVDPRPPQPDESATEFALMYGVDLHSKREIFVLSAGIGYVNLRQRGRLLPNSPSGYVYEARIEGSLGIAVDLVVLLPVSERVAFGLTGVGNFNPIAFIGGGMLTLAIGGFR